jgi:hypothetical protein
MFFPSPYVALEKLLLKIAAPEWLIGGLFRFYPLAAFAYCTAAFVAIFRSLPRRRWMDGGLTILLSMIVATLLFFPFNANEYKAVYVLLPFLIAYNVPKGPNPAASAIEPKNPAKLINPHSVSVGFCFFLLANRYGLIGNKLWASMITSFVIALFPLLLSALLARDSVSRAIRPVDEPTLQ